ncbi:MAG TPA: hypothetical protein EYG85_00045 [Crocinitomix sp.]|nr:hypothetical protein [Crocinitomix sp.]
MNNLTTFKQLKSKFVIDNFAQKTVYQINKDLNGLTLMQVYFKLTNDNLKEISNQLSLILKDLSENSQLQQFIYLVDLPEKQWRLFLSNNDFIFLCHQIIIREAQKVYLKEMFSKSD